MSSAPLLVVVVLLYARRRKTPRLPVLKVGGSWIVDVGQVFVVCVPFQPPEGGEFLLSVDPGLCCLAYMPRPGKGFHLNPLQLYSCDYPWMTGGSKIFRRCPRAARPVRELK